MATNLQGLTPEQMTKIGSQTSPQDTIDVSKTKPGQLITGAMTGMTPTNNMIAPTATQYQAITNSSPTPSQNISDAIGSENSGTLTSAPANSYIENLRQEAAQKEAQLRDYVKQAEGTQISSSSKNAYISQLPPEDPNESQVEKDLRNTVMQGGFGGLSAGNALGALNEARRVREEAAKAKSKLSEAQASDSATARVGAFRMGQSGTPYAQSAMEKIKRRQQEEMGKIVKAETDAMSDAWNSALRGNFNMAEQFRVEAGRAFDERVKIEQLAMQEREQVAKLQQFEDERSLKAQDRAMGTIQNLVKAGFTADQVPESYLDEMDVQSGMPKGFSRQVFDISQAEKEAVAVQNEEELKVKRIESAKKIVDIMKSLPKGESITIDGVEYSGLDVGNLKTGMEVNQETGLATAWSFNPATGEVITTPMGNIGTKKDGFETVTLGDGSIWRVNPKTGQSEPFYASQAQTTWNAILPEGEKGPVLPGNPAAAGQCGAFCNWAYGTRILPNKFSEKQTALKKYEVSKEDVEVGDTFLMSAGDTGHVGIVNGVDYGPDGKVVLKFTESNMVPPGGGQMSHSRTMSIDDPRLKMFARIPTPNLPIAGPDSEVSQIAYGGATPQILGAGTKGKKEEELLSVDEATKLGVPYGTTKSQAAQQRITPKKEIKPVEFGDKMAFQKMVKDDPYVKDFPVLKRSVESLDSAYQAAVQAGNNKTSRAAADQTLITVFNKVLDPGSVVREGEYARTEEGQSLLTRLQGKYDKLKQGGTGIDNAARKEMVDIAKQLYNNSLKEYTSTMDFYEKQAADAGIDASIYLRRVDRSSQPASNLNTSLSSRVPSRPTQSPPSGEIWVVDRNGQVGSLPQNEFDSNQYTKL